MQDALRHERIAIPTLWLAVAASVLLHLALLAGWIPRTFLQPSDEGEAAGRKKSLAVRIERPPAPPPAPAEPAIPPEPIGQAPAQRPSAPRAAPRPVAPPKVMTTERPATTALPAPAPEVPASPAPSSTGGATDLAAYIAARRRAREGGPPSAPSPPVESEQERHNRTVASSLGLDRTPTFAGDQAHGGGIFQIVRVGYTEGEFLFFGWNKAIARNSRQLIEVQRGTHRSTEVAIVRRMIDIIREHEPGDFTWESRRLGRHLTLSARPQHDAELEAFLMKEFFTVVR